MQGDGDENAFDLHFNHHFLPVVTTRLRRSSSMLLAIAVNTLLQGEMCSFACIEKGLVMLTSLVIPLPLATT